MYPVTFDDKSFSNVGACAGSIPTRRRTGASPTREKKAASLFVAHHSAFLSSPSSICLGSAASSASLPSLSSSWNSCAFGSGTAGQDDDRVLARCATAKRAARGRGEASARRNVGISEIASARMGSGTHVRCGLEALHRLPEAFAELGELARPEEHRRDPADDDELGEAEAEQTHRGDGPAPRTPGTPAVTMPALSAEGLPRNAGADPVRPDMAHDLGACAP